MIINHPSNLPVIFNDLANFIAKQNSVYTWFLYGSLIIGTALWFLSMKTLKHNRIALTAASIFIIGSAMLGLIGSVITFKEPNIQQVKADTTIVSCDDLKFINTADALSFEVQNKNKKPIIKGTYESATKTKLTPVNQAGKNVLTMEKYVKKHHLIDKVVRTNTVVGKKYVMVQYVSKNDVNVLIAQNGKVKQILLLRKK